MDNLQKPNIELESLSDRHRAILDILQLQGSISVSDLSERLSVSEVTIRKDLSTLEKQNKLYRTHGRAIPISPYIGDRHINEKEKQMVREKRAIGKLNIRKYPDRSGYFSYTDERINRWPKRL